MIYSCGHNAKGDQVPLASWYWNLLPHQRMPMSSGLCPECTSSRVLDPIVPKPGSGPESKAPSR